MFKFILPLILFSSLVFGQTFIQGPALVEGITVTTSAAGTTTLTKNSQTNQVVIGSTTQTIKLPDATTIPVGRTFYVVNKSTGIVTVNDNSNVLVVSVGSNQQTKIFLQAHGTSAGLWYPTNPVSGTTSPLTTKGDVWGYSTVDDRIPIGSNGQVLTADSTQTLGLKWATPAATGVTSVALAAPAIFTVSGSPVTSSGTLTLSYSGTALPIANGGTAGTSATTGFNNLSPITTKGDLISKDSTNNIRVAVGTDGQFLSADSSQTSGLKWSVGTGGAYTPTVQTFCTSGCTGGASGTYTLPANVISIHVRMVGGGGGGSGSGTTGGTAATDGSATTFGSSLLNAGGGSHGVWNAGGATGGTASLGTGPIGTALSGAGSFGFMQVASGGNLSPGGSPGIGAFGGMQPLNPYSSAGANGVAKTGTGGQGGGGNNTAGADAGTGGAAGGFIDAIINSPSATYTYSVGTGGTGGGAGTSGLAGGNGAEGYIEVTEYYANGAIGTATALTGSVTPTNLPTSSFVSPTIQSITSGSGTYNKNYAFIISSGSATVGATYTNNSVTFTVYATVSSSTLVYMTGNSSPNTSGTLTKATGTGDATLTFSLSKAPLYLAVEMIGAGGGGAGSGSASGTAATSGGATTFGSSLLSAGGGSAASFQGGLASGGTSSLGTGPIGTALSGGNGGGYSTNQLSLSQLSGGAGGNSALGGGAGASNAALAGAAAATNTGGGGSGGGIGNINSLFTGGGGGGGGYVKAIIAAPSATYSYAVGAAGSGGGAGTNGSAGGNGGSGYIEVTEYYQ